MDTPQDIRWKQRFSNYRKALAQLSKAVGIIEEVMSRSYFDINGVDDLLKEGLIQRFEYTQELAWNVMKDYENYQGDTNVTGSRDAIRKALAIGIIEDKRWMNTIEARNLTSHNYDDETAQEIYENITDIYYPLFVEFERKMLGLSQLEISFE